MLNAKKWLCLLAAFGLFFTVAQVAKAQETTGGLQGHRKRPFRGSGTARKKCPWPARPW
jgi:hypothetical protein